MQRFAEYSSRMVNRSCDGFINVKPLSANAKILSIIIKQTGPKAKKNKVSHYISHIR